MQSTGFEMDQDWRTGTAELRPKPDKDQDWGRSNSGYEGP